MTLICITGKSGSGKTYLANMLACKLVAESVDIDSIAHEVMDSSEMRQKIRASFGSSVFCGLKIDRKKLGEILFSDKQKLSYVENLTQFEMEKKIDEIIQKTTANYVVLEYSLLPLMKYFRNSQFNILVEASDDVRKNRIISRDNISEDYFFMREKNSLEYNEKDYNLVVDNTKCFDIDFIISKIKESMSKNKNIKKRRLKLKKSK